MAPTVSNSTISMRPTPLTRQALNSVLALLERERIREQAESEIARLHDQAAEALHDAAGNDDNPLPRPAVGTRRAPRHSHWLTRLDGYLGDAMKRSEDRILTTHTGSLPRPPEVLPTLLATGPTHRSTAARSVDPRRGQ